MRMLQSRLLYHGSTCLTFCYTCFTQKPPWLAVDPKFAKPRAQSKVIPRAVEPIKPAKALSSTTSVVHDKLYREGSLFYSTCAQAMVTFIQPARKAGLLVDAVTFRGCYS
jgi:hypothetical protein